jgi:hemerythrin superfamily protein
MTTTTRSQTTDAIELLKSDHRKVKEMFRRYEALGENAHKTKQRLAEEIFRELEIHSKLEEELFYPTVRERGDSEVQDVVDEGIEEHHVVDVLIEELRGLSPDEDAYDAKMKVLSENVEHHIEEEETEMLPDAKKILGSETKSIGEEMLQLKKSLAQA